MKEDMDAQIEARPFGLRRVDVPVRAELLPPLPVEGAKDRRRARTQD
jgi:hypothetical protein